MVHVFALVIYLGYGPNREDISNNLYFYRLENCNYYAKELVRRYGYPERKDYGTAYCVPKLVNPQEVKVYD